MALVEWFQSEKAYFERQVLATFLCNLPAVEAHRFIGKVEQDCIVDLKEYLVTEGISFNKTKSL